MNDLEIAQKIILKSLKTGKLLVEFSDWLKIDYATRVKAYSSMTCGVCHKTAELTGKYEHVFGTDPCCQDCDNYTPPAFPLVYTDKEYASL